MDARSCWISHVEGEIHPLCCLCPSLAAPWALTSALGLLAGRASVARAALAGAGVSHQDGLPVVLARSTAAGVEFQQELIQSPFQVLPFGFHVAEVAPAEDFVDGLQLRGMEVDSMEAISAGHQLGCSDIAG